MLCRNMVQARSFKDNFDLVTPNGLKVARKIAPIGNGKEEETVIYVPREKDANGFEALDLMRNLKTRTSLLCELNLFLGEDWDENLLYYYTNGGTHKIGYNNSYPDSIELLGLSEDEEKATRSIFTGNREAYLALEEAGALARDFAVNNLENYQLLGDNNLLLESHIKRHAKYMMQHSLRNHASEGLDDRIKIDTLFGKKVYKAFVSAGHARTILAGLNHKNAAHGYNVIANRVFNDGEGVYIRSPYNDESAYIKDKEAALKYIVHSKNKAEIVVKWLQNNKIDVDGILPFVGGNSSTDLSIYPMKYGHPSIRYYLAEAKKTSQRQILDLIDQGANFVFTSARTSVKSGTSFKPVNLLLDIMTNEGEKDKNNPLQVALDQIV